MSHPTAEKRDGNAARGTLGGSKYERRGFVLALGAVGVGGSNWAAFGGSAPGIGSAAGGDGSYGSGAYGAGGYGVGDGG